VLIYALAVGIAAREILPFALILLVASVPVALPATFTVATALGALELAHQGVLVTRLSAIEEAAGMDVLCSDKTGTITENRLSVAAVRTYQPYGKEEVLRLAAAACDESTQDALDLAILRAAQNAGIVPLAEQRLQFIPFDPATKRSEAVLRQGEGSLRVVKGAPQIVGGLCTGGGESMGQDVERLAAEGYRILAVAAGVGGALHLAGLIGLHDSPRADSRQLVHDLNDLGVRVLMVTGDSPATAQTVACQVGIGERVCSPEQLRQEWDANMPDCEVFAGVLLEDKYRLVQALQRQEHTVGMTGDGVNDAPAMKQAEVGIAVANATDVAKAAASLVLANPGLGDIVAAVQTSRRIYQRMLTYTLNKIVKTIEIALLLSLGLLFTGTFVTTPVLIVLLLFTNDFVTMSLATDRVSFSRTPDRWRIRSLVLTALPLAILILALSFGLFLWGRDVLTREEKERILVLLWVVLGSKRGSTMFGLIPRRKEKRGDGFWRYEPPMEILRCEFAPLFERMFGGWPAFAESEGTPPYGPEMEDVGEAIVVREAVPGFEAKEIEVTISGNLLAVHAERKAKEGETGKFWGELERTVLLPEGVDTEHVEATYHNGVLEVRLPKLPEAKQKRIEVKT
jgi:H+-transporting ATPase